MSYSFFFSYASDDDKNSDGQVRWFFDLLEKRLKIAHGPVDEAFFAPRIEAGEDWKEKVQTGLNSSGILICLQSPLYFASRVCGQELEAFLGRRKLYKRAGGEPPDCVIPILWQPLTGITVPKALPNDFQGKKPSANLTPFPMDGLYKAILADSTEKKQQIVLYALNLAERISNLIRKNTGQRALPPLPVIPDLDVVPSAFDFPEWPLPDLDEEKGTGPASITLVYPTGPPEGLPFSPPPPNAIISAAALAKSREWIFQGVGFSGLGDIVEKLAKVKWAQAKKSPVVLMLTEPLLQDRALLNRLDQMEDKKGLATIVLSTASEGQLPGDFPASLNAILATRDKFDDLLIKSVGRVRSAIMAEATAAPGTLPGF